MALASIWNRVEPLLDAVERPSRYINHEFVGRPSAEYLAQFGQGASHTAAARVDFAEGDGGALEELKNDEQAEVASGKPAGSSDGFNFVMCYPDTYELGQPNQAVRILVNAVNAALGLHAERAYLPAVDMADAMRASGVPAFSLESCAPLADFDCVGITLPHELAATNICELLDLGGIPVLAADRADDDPIVIAGGPCAYNPEPYALFFDAIQIGEGEESTPELLYVLRDARSAGKPRAEILRLLAQISGVYVPALYELKPSTSWGSELPHGVSTRVSAARICNPTDSIANSLAPANVFAPHEEAPTSVSNPQLGSVSEAEGVEGGSEHILISAGSACACISRDVTERLRDSSRSDVSRTAEGTASAPSASFTELANEEAPTFPILTYATPTEDGVPEVIVKRVWDGFATSPGFEPMVVPFCECVHDRLNVEILRGCARGCRFCQAGMMYRPVRERSVDNIVASVREGLRVTGYDEVSLTSLSSTDHSRIEEILRRLNKEFAGSGIKVSIPSQRLDSFGVNMAGLVAGAKRGGLTFAPEAGTQRMRDVINKGVSESDLFEAVEQAVLSGWRTVKLYFMIGLPTERDEDCVGIAELANQALEHMRNVADPKVRGSLKVNVSIAVFVPKSQTPFQWDGQIDRDEALRRVHLVKDALRYRAIKASYHDPETSQIEAALSRGGREVGELVYEAWRRGARFDAWSEHFSAAAWEAAEEATGVNVAAIAHAELPTDARLPWDHISCGVSKRFLLSERKRAFAEQTTPDCTFGRCSACGVCMDMGVDNILQAQRGGEGA